MAQVNGKISLVIIDEDGDTFIILQNPIERLKPWPGFLTQATSKTRGAHTGNAIILDDDVIGARSQVQVPAQPEPEFHYQVSSTLLKNASRYFRHMLSGRFSESALDPSDGKYHITASEFHPEAMEHVMNIIHVQNQRLPQKVYLDTLAHIAVLVDYYGLHDVVSFHTDIWTKYVARKKMPEHYCLDLILRTFVARAFGDKKNLRRGAELILRHSMGPILDLGIPLLDLDDILNQGRSSIIKDVISTIDNLPTHLKHRKLGCSDVCRQILLNSFVKKRSMRLWGPTFNGSEYPFHGVSFATLTSGLLSCAELDDPYIDGGNRIHLCDLGEFVGEAVEVGERRMRDVLEGLSL